MRESAMPATSFSEVILTTLRTSSQATIRRSQLREQQNTTRKGSLAETLGSIRVQLRAADLFASGSLDSTKLHKHIAVAGGTGAGVITPSVRFARHFHLFLQLQTADEPTSIHVMANLNPY